ncbi:MAG TPA: DUF4345 domain-containing protein [Myxococcota bacterium]|nr:DUF4345 domain-containing protein [Myxococcota bacterium]
MYARVFLVLSALLWLPYGLYCLIDPGSLAQAAGVVARTPTGTTELRAMYGGLQAAIGVLALVGAIRGSVTRSALVAIGTLTLGLGSARLLGALMDGGFTSYTGMGLGFEWTSALVSRWLLSRQN